MSFYGFPGSSTQQTPNYAVMVRSRPSLLGYWKFGETSGNFRDELGLHDVTVSGGTGGVRGAPGPIYDSWSFQNSGGDTLTWWNQGGVYGYVKRSVECWFSAAADGVLYSDYSGGTGYTMQIRNAGLLDVEERGDNTEYGRLSTVNVLDGKWHHWVGMIDGVAGNLDYSYFRIFLDGQEVQYTNHIYNSYTLPPYCRTITMSGNIKISEYAIYAEALPAQWIYDHYRTAR